MKTAFESKVAAAVMQMLGGTLCKIGVELLPGLSVLARTCGSK